MSYIKLLRCGYLFLALSNIVNAQDEQETSQIQVKPWVAVDPWKDHVYERESVHPIATGASVVGTVVGGVLYFGAVGGSFYYFDITNLDEGMWLDSSRLASIEGGLLIAGNVIALPTVGLWSNMLATYAGKQAGTVIAEGWKYVRYGYDMVKYFEHHLRAQYMQGTIYEVKDVQYRPKSEAEETDEHGRPTSQATHRKK